MGSIKIRLVKDFELLEERMRRMMDSFFGDWVRPQESTPGFRPAADIYEVPAGIVIRMDLAGVGREDLSLTLGRRELVVTGRRRFPTTEPVQRFYNLEIDYGPFERKFQLPRDVDEALVQAEHRQGLLTIYLPWRQPAAAQKIPVTEL